MSSPKLQKVAPPALPQARNEFDRPYQDQLNNVHRLFYNRLTQSFNYLISPGTSDEAPGAVHLYTPYAAVQRTTNKTFTANTATLITFDTNDFLSGCTNDGTGGVAVEHEALYNCQFSVQWKNTASQDHAAWIWFRVDGVDVAGTSSQFSIPAKHGSVNGHLIAAANFYLQVGAGKQVAMYAAVDNTAVSMEAYPVQASPFVMPSIPSVVMTISFVSAV
jgi:hypothetical protein